MIALWWTNRSFDWSSGVMKPKPLSSLNHFTVPVAIDASSVVMCEAYAEARVGDDYGRRALVRAIGRSRVRGTLSRRRSVRWPSTVRAPPWTRAPTPARRTPSRDNGRFPLGPRRLPMSRPITTPPDTAVRPFAVRFPDEEVADLRRRVLATRWPERETVADDSQGVPLGTMKA